MMESEPHHLTMSNSKLSKLNIYNSFFRREVINILISVQIVCAILLGVVEVISYYNKIRLVVTIEEYRLAIIAAVVSVLAGILALYTSYAKTLAKLHLTLRTQVVAFSFGVTIFILASTDTLAQLNYNLEELEQRCANCVGFDGSLVRTKAGKSNESTINFRDLMKCDERDAELTKTNLGFKLTWVMISTSILGIIVSCILIGMVAYTLYRLKALFDKLIQNVSPETVENNSKLRKKLNCLFTSEYLKTTIVKVVGWVQVVTFAVLCFRQISVISLDSLFIEFVWPIFELMTLGGSVLIMIWITWPRMTYVKMHILIFFEDVSIVFYFLSMYIGSILPGAYGIRNFLVWIGFFLIFLSVVLIANVYFFFWKLEKLIKKDDRTPVRDKVMLPPPPAYNESSI